jgi:hypothetical protein
MSTTQGSSADMPFGDELSRTVAQFPAIAVLAHTSATAAATMSDLRTSDLLCSDAAYTPARRSGFHGNLGLRASWKGEELTKEALLGGQYVSITGPIRLLRGTVPHVRESQECVRLSPRTK